MRLLSIFLLFIAFGAGAEELPNIEAGVAFGAFYLPDYPGASESRTRQLVLPFMIYRGDFLRADREGGFRGRFLRREKVEFDFSFGAGFPTDSGDNDARAGMDDIDWIGEAGPRARVHLIKRPLVKLDLSLPVRYAFSTDFKDINSRGWIFNPELIFRHHTAFDRNLMFVVSTGGTWATERMHDYFFQVDPDQATATRPAFDAQGGYFGWNSGFSLVKLFDNGISLYAGISQNYYTGAKNEESPLLQDKVTESYFAGLAWVFYRKGVAHKDQEHGH